MSPFAAPVTVRPAAAPPPTPPPSSCAAAATCCALAAAAAAVAALAAASTAKNLLNKYEIYYATPESNKNACLKYAHPDDTL